MLKWEKADIDGVIIKNLKKNLDKRGYLCEIFRSDELPEGLKPRMSYVSYTEPGTTRGPHEHQEQTDIFAFLEPGNFLVRLWDNRVKSESYGKYMDIYAGRDNPILIVIPPGVVHGYKNISSIDRGMVINYPDQLYMGWNKEEKVDEIRHETDNQSPFTMED